MTITLPLPPNMANGRMHWRTKNRARQLYFDTCDMLCLTKQIPPPPPVPMPRVVISMTLYVGNAMDDDNALTRGKWSVDWLKTRGYIRDDRRTYCRFTIPAQVVKRGGNYLIDIVLSPIPEQP